MKIPIICLPVDLNTSKPSITKAINSSGEYFNLHAVLFQILRLA
jgi:hypothetical protein